MAKRKTKPVQRPKASQSPANDPNEPWVASLMIRGPKRSVKKAIADLEKREEKGQLSEIKLAEGPGDDMKGFLERQSKFLPNHAKPDDDPET